MWLSKVFACPCCILLPLGLLASPPIHCHRDSGLVSLSTPAKPLVALCWKNSWEQPSFWCVGWGGFHRSPTVWLPFPKCPSYPDSVSTVFSHSYEKVLRKEGTQPPGKKYFDFSLEVNPAPHWPMKEGQTWFSSLESVQKNLSRY